MQLSMLQIQRFTFNPFSENTYLVYDSQTKECAIIDPGCLSIHEQKTVQDFIASRHLQVKHLINTHCHIDHIVGNAFIKRTYGTKLAIHPAEVPMLDLARTHAPRYGIENYEPATADTWLIGGQEIHLGNHPLHIWHVPGHSPGHIALYSIDNNFCISGDVLFKNYIGRTDLPGGNLKTLLKSIHEKLFSLPDEVLLYAGHGATTTIGWEKTNNPFCKVKD
jgi:hydroxyacylglutathione hydrolase